MAQTVEILPHRWQVHEIVYWWNTFSYWNGSQDLSLDIFNLVAKIIYSKLGVEFCINQSDIQCTKNVIVTIVVVDLLCMSVFWP